MSDDTTTHDEKLRHPMKNCNYPNCTTCDKPECNMESNDISALLKRRRYKSNPVIAREKQNVYRNKIKENLPYCDECDMCVMVAKEKQDGYRRLCIVNMRLIEQKVSNCPQWCGRMKSMSDIVTKCDNEKITKVKVTSAEIIVSGKAEKPYFEIKYYDLADNRYHVGYSSYDLDIVFEWLKDCFEIIDEELAKEPQEEPNIPLECVDGSCPIALSEEYEEWGMDVVHSYAECPYQPQELVQDSQKLVKELAQDAPDINIRDCISRKKLLEDIRKNGAIADFMKE